MGEHAAKAKMVMEVVHVLVDIQVLVVNVHKEPMPLTVLLMIVLQGCMDQIVKAFACA